jgi:hypothetical protein
MRSEKCLLNVKHAVTGDSERTISGEWCGVVESKEAEEELEIESG